MRGTGYEAVVLHRAYFMNSGIFVVDLEPPAYIKSIPNPDT